MCMELRVLPARLAVHEFGNKDVYFLPLVAPVATPRVAELLDIPEGPIDRAIKRLLNPATLGLGAYGPKGRDILGSTQAEIQGCPTLGVTVVLCQRFASLWMIAVKEAFEFLLIDLAPKAKGIGCSVLMPHAGTLAPGNI